MGRGKSLVYGIGINDADYPIRVGGKFCPFYATWQRMLRRCYCKKTQVSQPSYKQASVCEEWKRFSNFKSWMETQDWEGKELDKDLLVLWNKIYSADTCVFIPKLINTFIISGSPENFNKLGAVLDKRTGNCAVEIGNPFTKTKEYVGKFDTCELAHQAWLARKLELAKLLAAEQDDPRVAEALVKRYENWSDSRP